MVVLRWFVKRNSGGLFLEEKSDEKCGVFVL
jgi:hypothetical protein